MTTYKISTATNRQKQRIQALAEEKGLPVNIELDDLGAFEASVVIEDLENRKETTQEKKENPERVTTQRNRVDKVRLGLAIKLVYSKWRYDVNGIVRDNNLRKCFIKEVVETYKLMSDIVQAVENPEESGGLDA